MAVAEDVFGLVGCEFDQLRFDQAIDQGGFGIVYRGHHLGLDEPVAIKCLRLDQKLGPALQAQFRDRFRDETKIAYRLSQGNLDIVRSITSGTIRAPTTGNMVPYMALEWLEGRTLTAELKSRTGPPMSVEEVVGLLDSAAGAIAYAHEQGVIHRDIKPANLFLTQTRQGRRLKVLDFGLAKALHMDAIVSPAEHTQSGFFICSPSYGAPELFIKSLGQVGPQTDVYSFALVFLEMLAGRKVRPAKGMADAILAVSTEATCSPNAQSLGLALAPAVDRVLRRAVTREVSARPANMGVFWSELRDAMLTVDSNRNLDMMATIANASLPATNLVRAAIRHADEVRGVVSSPKAPTPAAGQKTTAPMSAKAPPREVRATPTPDPKSRRPDLPIVPAGPDSVTSQMAGKPRPGAPTSDLAQTLPLGSPLLPPEIRGGVAPNIRGTVPLTRDPSGTFALPLSALPPQQSSSVQSPMAQTAGPQAVLPAVVLPIPPPHQPIGPQTPMQQPAGVAPQAPPPPGWAEAPSDWSATHSAAVAAPRSITSTPAFLVVLFLVLTSVAAGAVFALIRIMR